MSQIANKSAKEEVADFLEGKAFLNSILFQSEVLSL